MLYKHRFLYSDTKVIPTYLKRIMLTVSKGLNGVYHANFLLMIFNHHLTIIKDAQWVSGLSSSVQFHQPRAALAVSAAAVRHNISIISGMCLFDLQALRALTLWKDGSITMERLAEDSGISAAKVAPTTNVKGTNAKAAQAGKIKGARNQKGKETKAYAAFNATGYRNLTMWFLASIERYISKKEMLEIIEEAKEVRMSTDENRSGRYERVDDVPDNELIGNCTDSEIDEDLDDIPTMTFNFSSEC